jgi:hypothetical protein
MNVKVRHRDDCIVFFLNFQKWLTCSCLGIEQQGARRFVNYWESRREVFGDDKFVLPMTLGEALCDDLAAVEACVLSLLPHLDASGRQLLLSEPCRHTRDGYTSESMVSSVVWSIVVQYFTHFFTCTSS